MAGIKSMVVMVVLVVLASFQLQLTVAQTRHIVGDSIGWTIPTNGAGAYTTWAASQTFRGAPLQPISTETNGPATITLRTAGNHYYICAFGTHCQAGQKVTVKRLLAVPTHTHPASTSRAPAGSPPSTPDATTSPPPPSPSRNFNQPKHRYGHDIGQATVIKGYLALCDSMYECFPTPGSLPLKNILSFLRRRRNNGYASLVLTWKEIMQNGKPPLLPTPIKPTTTTTTTKTTPIAIKWISSAERQECLNKGLCFKCDNKWLRGHKCPGKILLLLAEEEDDIGADNTTEEDEAVESGDISILNSLIGHGSSWSLQLWGKVGTGVGYAPTPMCSGTAGVRGAEKWDFLGQMRMTIDTNVTAPNFKRWQQKMFFYLTTLNLARFLNETAPQVEPPKEESLERKYKTKDAGTKKFVVAYFLDYKMVDSKNVITQAVAIIEKYLQVWLEFKNSLKHKRKKISVEDLVARLGIEEHKKLAQKITYTPDYAKDNMVEHAGSSSKSNSKAKGKGKGKNDKKGKGNAEFFGLKLEL
ncbi:zinc finger, CCHC-type containing protein [Tanacetum coccineum]|uniref:Zinc finger, CCHC-type containing protein n=1 Tax=Tanacetum coccineum TaxID=301880 RepID=A0ABQ5HMB3_9ASTR